MKNLFFLSLFLIIVSCATNEGTYWCGDHPCINKKEREAYFKKTMIVEIKNLKKYNNKNNSEIEKIIQQAKLDGKKRIRNEKDLAKQARLEEKRRIKEEKDLVKQLKLEKKRQIDEKRMIKNENDLTKQAKLEEKRRIKEEKDLEKQIRLDEKRRIKEEKKLSRKKIVKNKNKQPEKNIKLDAGIENIKIESNKFKEFIEKITEKNALKPYPNINDIPN